MGLIIDHAAPRLPAPLPLPLTSWRLVRRPVIHLLLVLLLGLLGLLGATAARAQILDELELRREGADAVLQIRFTTGVQYQRSVVARSGDETLIFYRVLPTRQALTLATAERRLPARAAADGGAGLPSVRVVDEGSVVGRDTDRRVLVRLGAPTKQRVRAGRTDRVLELVFEGLGAQLSQPVPAAELPAALGGRFRVTLEASEQAGSFLSAAIPATLQDANLFTTRRVAEGKVLYETHLGPYATRSEAESALRGLRGRFPKAAVTVDAPAGRILAQASPASPAPAAAPVPPPVLPSVPAIPSAAASAPVAVAATAASAAAPAPAASAATQVAVAAPAAAAASAPEVMAPAAPADPDLDRRAAALLAQAREALARGETQAAIDQLGAVLDLPPTTSTRSAQALIGQARLKAGDTGRARAEFEAFLRQYPKGEDSDAVRAALTVLSGGEAPRAAGAGPAQRPATTTLTGSISSTWYAGQSKVRTQEFQESLLGGLPELVSDATLSSADQKQLVSSVDVNWRHRDAESDQRFVFRDSYTKDQLRPERTRNKLSSLYYDHKSFSHGTSLRVGRQTPLSGGVLGRFDGIQAGYAFKPRWKANIVAGVPTDTLLDTKRHFYGASIDAEAITPQFGGSLYLVQQIIDGEIDRRALGSELRYFDGGLSGSAQLDYDVMLKGMNIASLQGTWQRPDNTVFNFMYDRRKQPMLMLGNTLFFTDANLTLRPTRVSDLLGTTTLEVLRERAKTTTAVSTQASLGVTTPINPRWQVGGDLRYTSTGAVAPVPDILPTGLPASGDIWSLSAQVIGTNLYSVRDTHVLIANFLNGPTFQGQLLSYNNSSALNGQWQLEPSLKYYRQTDNLGTRNTRWSPGLRVTFRIVPQAAIESEVNVENSKTTGPTRNESSSRTFFYVGGRYDF